MSPSVALGSSARLPQPGDVRFKQIERGPFRSPPVRSWTITETRATSSRLNSHSSRTDRFQRDWLRIGPPSSLSNVRSGNAAQQSHVTGRIPVTATVVIISAMLVA